MTARVGGSSRRPGAGPTTTPPGPVRTCVACRRRRPASQLVRVGRLPDGTLRPGRTLPGRGAWLCADRPECLHVVSHRRALERAMRSPVTPEAVARLAACLVAPPGGPS